MKSILPLAFAAATAAGIWGTSATAQEPDAFKGKTINLIVGFGPGGENDEWARMIAAHISRHLPGNPTVVVQSCPAPAAST